MSDKQVNEYVNGERAVLNRYPWLLATKWVYDKMGLPTLLIVFGLCIYTGLVPSPLTDLANALLDHVKQTDELIEILKKR
jgi:hypothetical protein